MKVESGTFSLESVSPGNTTRPADNGPSFSDRLRSAVESVNATQLKADDHLAAIASGEEVDLHGAMIALQEADITLRTMVSVRDKVVDGYQQLIGMSI